MSALEKQATANIHDIVKNNKLELLQSVVSQDSTAASLTDATGNTPLHTCSACGHIHIATFLCETALVNPSPRNNDGQTPLHLACEEGHLTVASYLTDERGCDPSMQDNEGKTPLHLAAANNRLSIVRYLVEEKRVDVNCKTTKHSTYRVRKPLGWWGLDAPGKTPLHYASMQGHALVVEYLLTQKECDPMCLDDNGITPLFYSSLNGHLTIVRKQSHDIYKPNKFGNLPLHAASAGGHLAVVRYFICEKGLDPAIPSQRGRTPLHYACYKGHQDIIDFLVNDQRCDPMILDANLLTPLYLASMNGHLQVVEMLVDEKGCDVYCRDKEGDLPLHAASWAGHLAVVRYFICKKGVDPAIHGQWGRAALHNACDKGHQDIIDFLINDQGCDPMILDANLLTPLYLASMNGHLQVVEMLVKEKGCDTNFINKNGDLPLHAASLNGHLAVVRYFICEKGVDPAIPGQLGRTALHNACDKGHQDIIDYLLNDQTCDPMILDANLLTPLYLASMNGHLKVVEMLVDEKGCDVYCRDKDGNLPLHAASLGGHLAVVRYFICEKGVGSAILNYQGRPPLHYAYQKHHQDIISFLVNDQGCDPMICKMNPLYLASIKGYLKAVEMLVDVKGCDVYCRDEDGNLPLHAASWCGHLAVVRYFICETGVDPAIPGQLGRTPLHYACQEGHNEIISFLLNDQGCNSMILDENGTTPLYLASMRGHLNTVELLVDEKGCDAHFANKDGNLPIHAASSGGHLTVVRYFICEKGVDPEIPGHLGKTPLGCATDHNVQAFLFHVSKSLIPSIRVSIIGDSGAGKSTLKSALMNESFLYQYFQVSGVQPNTIGIVPFDFESKHYGPVTFYDFSGHREYYSGHSDMFNNVTPEGSIFILVTNISEDSYFAKLLYWLKFLESSSNTKYHIIVVLSHSDRVVANRKSESLEKISSIKSIHPKIARVMALDCRYPSSTGELKRIMKSICHSLRNSIKVHYTSKFLFGILTQLFEGRVLVTLSEVINSFGEDSILTHILKTADEVISYLDALNSSGNLLFMKNPQQILNSWIILDNRTFLSQVQTLQYNTSSNTGLVTYSQLKDAANSKGFDENLISDYLLKMEYCCEVTDSDICSSPVLEKGEKVFFFPHLIKDDFCVSSPHTDFGYFFGWMLNCSTNEHFFTPRFTHVLLLRLAYHRTSAEVTSSNIGQREYYHYRKCYFWKNGIHWADDGVECLVEVSVDSSSVHLMMRSYDESVLQMCKLRSQVISTILAAKQDYCPTVKTDEFVVMPSAVNQYPPQWNEVPLFSISAIADGVVMGKHHVPVHDYYSRHEMGVKPSESFEAVLTVEPFACLSSETVRYCFLSSTDGIISDLFLLQLAKDVAKSDFNVPFPPIVEKHVDHMDAHSLLKEWKSKTNGTFGDLIKEVGNYSVFCARSPLVW